MRRLPLACLILLVATVLLSCGGGGNQDHEKTATPTTETATPTHASATPTAILEPTKPSSTPKPTGLWTYCRQVGTSADWLEEPPDGAAPGYLWRCYQGMPLYCEPGATAGACMKLSYNASEPEGAAEWCREHTFLPMAITGHGPQIYQWDCFNGQVIRKDNSLYDPDDYDDMGFARNSWRAAPEPEGAETEVPPPPPASTFALPPPATYGCESSYPDVCLPHPLDEDNLECRHIPFRNFRVLAPDPYEFDQDGDGIGCEWPAADSALSADPAVGVIAYYKFIDRREFEQAWALMGSAITTSTTYDTFASWFKNKVSIWREEVRVVSMNGGRAEVEAIVRSEDWVGGRQVSQRYQERWELVFEEGAWKLSRLLLTVPIDAGTSSGGNGTNTLESLPTPSPTSIPLPPTPPPAPTSRVCCKYCTTGKACGDTCISRSYTCHKPPGCACNAY